MAEAETEVHVLAHFLLGELDKVKGGLQRTTEYYLGDRLSGSHGKKRAGPLKCTSRTSTSCHMICVCATIIKLPASYFLSSDRSCRMYHFFPTPVLLFSDVPGRKLRVMHSPLAAARAKSLRPILCNTLHTCER